MDYNTLTTRNPGITPTNSPNPFAYVLIPVIFVGVLTALVSCWRFRRRRRLITITQTDIEGNPRTRTRVDRGPNGIVIITNGDGSAHRSRRAGRRLGLGVGSREEGLNELGEAPPAYAPDGPKPGVENIELREYSQATAAEGSTNYSPPDYERVETQRAAAEGSRTTEDNGEGGSTHSASAPQEMPATSRLQELSATTAPQEMSATATSGETPQAATPNETEASTRETATIEPTPPPRAVLPSS
ncbi:hypothetical protein F5Y16DRAFT_393886 [Xylariaceae sp. FL0255]|nr:hypothetical protein F5Y16DRAFT_393886 [Xylariaceae sp. FL0255]